MCSLTHVLIIETIVVSLNDVILRLCLADGTVVGVTATRGDTTCVICCVGVSGTRDNVLKLELLFSSGTTNLTGGDETTGRAAAAALATDAAFSVNSGGLVLLRFVWRYECAWKGSSNGVFNVVTSSLALLSVGRDESADGVGLRLPFCFGGMIALWSSWCNKNTIIQDTRRWLLM